MLSQAQLIFIGENDTKGNVQHNSKAYDNIQFNSIKIEHANEIAYRFIFSRSFANWGGDGDVSSLFKHRFVKMKFHDPSAFDESL